MTSINYSLINAYLSDTNAQLKGRRKSLATFKKKLSFYDTNPLPENASTYKTAVYDAIKKQHDLYAADVARLQDNVRVLTNQLEANTNDSTTSR